MTNSEPIRTRAAELLERVVDLLDEGRVAQLIDEPIDKALDEFIYAENTGHTPRSLLETTARFIAHVYEAALPGVRKLTTGQARDEAVALLSRAYKGTHGDGLGRARVDATDASGPEMESVLAQLAESIKNERRQMYARWVQSWYIDSADWPTKCAMAAILLEQCREYLPAELRRCTPEQWAGGIFDLLDTDLSTNNRLQPVFAHLFSPWV